MGYTIYTGILINIMNNRQGICTGPCAQVIAHFRRGSHCTALRDWLFPLIYLGLSEITDKHPRCSPQKEGLWELGFNHPNPCVCKPHT